VRVLTVNAGSSSLKLALLDGEDRVLGEQELPAGPQGPDDRAVRDALRGELSGGQAASHRIVHGGERFTRPVLLDEDVERELAGLSELAPLHQAKSLAALATVREALPEVPHVACFDTSFHTTIPPAAHTYALPAGWRERHPLRRFGFHGLSHSWVAARVPELVAGAAGAGIISCHLGAGASVCAIDGGRSCDTTMGFTPLEGLVMATRSGSVDPGMLPWLMEHEHLSPAQLADALEHDSGLLGLAGTADMREVLAAAGAGDERAGLALSVYVHRLRGAIAAMAAAIGGVGVLVFTGGVGERSPEVREGAASGLAFLGVALDHDANAGAEPDCEIGAPAAAVRTLVIRAREDIELARGARELLQRPDQGPDQGSP
jgi:acetate kinase